MFPKKSLFHVIFAISCLMSSVNAQITFGGYIKLDGIYDSRQTVSLREGHFHLWPAARTAGATDSNEDNNILLATFQTRLFGKIQAPDALGAKVSGYLEGDFFGATETGLSHYVLRHAYMKMEWKNREVLLGQTWSPLFGTVFPSTINFSTGMPMQPFSRNPQIALTLKNKENTFRTTGTILAERDAFAEVGLGSAAQRRSGMPMAALDVTGGNAKVSAGVTALFRPIKPIAGEDNVNTGAVSAYLKYNTSKVVLQARGVLGEDMGDHIMMGGMAKLTNGATVSYKPFETTAAWVDIANKKNPSVGLFAGITQNGGLKEAPAAGTVLDYSGVRGNNIENVWRVSPRIVYNSGKLRLAAEYEATSAMYASGRDANMAPMASATDEAVINHRVLLGAYLFF